jgi:hypothetical protein
MMLRAQERTTVVTEKVDMVRPCLINVEPWEVCEYPDFDKVMARVVGPGGRRTFRALFPRAAAVDYWHGEPLAEEAPAGERT